MLFKTLDNLRTKPKVVRDQFAFMVAVVFTILIAAIWALSLPSRLERITAGEQATTTTPFAGFFSQFKSQFSHPAETVATTTVASDGTSAASTTEAALTLDLSSTTKAALESSGTTIRFSSTTIQSGGGRPILIATTSSATTTD